MYLWYGRPWWRHQMETLFALLAICVGNSLVTGEFLAQRPVTRSFGGFFDLRLNKRLSKQSWAWWIETPSRSLWRHRNALISCILYWSDLWICIVNDYIHCSKHLREQGWFFIPHSRRLIQLFLQNIFYLNNDLVECSTQLLQNICKNI